MRRFRIHGEPYLQDLLTILKEATSRSPSSSLVFFMPPPAAASLASSFALCMMTWETRALHCYGMTDVVGERLCRP